MKFELSRLARNCSNEEIIAEIRRIDSLINKKTLSQKDFNKHSKINSSTAGKRFGSWEKALVDAGLKSKYLVRHDTTRTAGSENVTNEQLIAEVQRISKQLGKESVSGEEFRLHSTLLIHRSSALTRFGSWANLMKAAGLSCRHRYLNEEYFENLLKVWTHHGRQPTGREIDQYPSTISSGGYENRFGSWRKAFETFVVRMNKDHAETEENLPKQKSLANKTTEEISEKAELIGRAIKPEDRRGISLSLRYKVLVRDNFKCVRCGRSPATSHGLELHVDHKDPFSKGGKTTLENLETKCKECNLGKGNRHIES